MKTITAVVAASVIIASVGVASAQTAQSGGSSGAFESFVPLANSGVVYTGRSAYVDTSNTANVYGVGPDGQGVLAPHINGVF